MKPEPSILCYGELLLRLAPPRHELFMQSPELRASIVGAEANVAVALASFGRKASMLSVVPDNFVGDAAISELRRHGVDTSAIRRTDGRMGVLYLVPGAVRRPTEVEYDRKDSCFATNPEIGDLDQELSRANWFHVSGVTPALGSNCATSVIETMQRACSRKITTSFDGNYRSKLWRGREDEAPAILRAMLECTNIFLGNERDFSLILDQEFDGKTESDRTRKAAEAAFKLFPNLWFVACTRRKVDATDTHTYGAEFYSREECFAVPGIELRGIVDRIGTGDAFAAGMIHGLLRGMSHEATLRFAHGAASLKHSIPGDFMTLGEEAVVQASGPSVIDVRR
jgi:2-dehydro-3-deoxygluconokinase